LSPESFIDRRRRRADHGKLDNDKKMFDNELKDDIVAIRVSIK
jgi:hypothetical protein